MNYSHTLSDGERLKLVDFFGGESVNIDTSCYASEKSAAIHLDHDELGAVTLKLYDHDESYRKEIEALQRLQGSYGVPDLHSHGTCEIQISGAQYSRFILRQRVDGECPPRPADPDEFDLVMHELEKFVAACGASNVLPGDPKPENAVWNPDSKTLWWIDYGWFKIAEEHSEMVTITGLALVSGFKKRLEKLVGTR